MLIWVSVRTLHVLYFLLELCFTSEGWCCTTGGVTTQRTAPVFGWALNTCLEKLWKHLVTNGMHRSVCLSFPTDVTEAPEKAVINLTCTTSQLSPVLMCIRSFISTVRVTVVILTAVTHRVQLCVLSTVTDTTTPLMALSMTTTLTVRSICSK